MSGSKWLRWFITCSNRAPSAENINGRRRISTRASGIGARHCCHTLIDCLAVSKATFIAARSSSSKCSLTSPHTLLSSSLM